jgi:hypothetical protein
LYGEQSDIIVPVLCAGYEKKRWTGWEWVHIYSLLTREEGKRVMPCRFDYATADGLSPAAGFIELDNKTPEETATLILQRLALNEGRPQDSCLANAEGDWHSDVSGSGLEEAYRRYLIQSLGKLHLPLSNRSVDLETVFVRPKGQKPEEQYDLGTAEPSASHTTGTFAEWQNDSPQLAGRRVHTVASRTHGETFEPIDVLGALHENPAIILSGGSGAGKTTLLNYLALTFARRECKNRLDQDEDRLPVIANLRELTQPVKDSPALLDWLEGVVRGTVNASPGQDALVATALAARRCIILLDGFDEIPPSNTYSGMARAIAEFTNRYVGNRFIVTSRRHALDDAKSQAFFGPFAEILLCPFEQAERKQLAHNYYRARSARYGQDDSATANRLLAALSSDRGIEKLASNPLMLSVLAALHRQSNVLPRTRQAVFEACGAYFLDTWPKIRESDASVSVWNTTPLSTKIRLVGNLALWFHERGTRVSVPHDHLVAQLARDLSTLIGAPVANSFDNASGFLRDLVFTVGLLVESDKGAYSFSHLVFQEYFAAVGITQLADPPGYIAARLEEESWHEPIVLTAAQLSGSPDADAEKRTTAFIRAIYDPDYPRDGSSRALRMFLAARCIAESKAEAIDKRFQEQTAEDVARLWTKSSAGKERATDIDAVSFLIQRDGGDFLRRELLRLLDSSRKTDRRLALDALAWIGMDAVTPRLIDVLFRIANDAEHPGFVAALYAMQTLALDERCRQQIAERLKVLAAMNNPWISWLARAGLGEIPMRTSASNSKSTPA